MIAKPIGQQKDKVVVVTNPVKDAATLKKLTASTKVFDLFIVFVTGDISVF
jgi:hypothetical protein